MPLRDYIKQAEQAERLAVTLTVPSERQAIIDMAQFWRRKAAEIDSGSEPLNA